MIFTPKRIRELREIEGLSQRKLAEKANVSQQDISNIEKEKHSPTYKTIQKILNAMNYYMRVDKNG